MTKEEKKQARLEKKQARLEKKLDKKEKIYQEKYGVSYRELIKKSDKKESKQNKKLLNSLLRSEKKIIIICYSFIALLSAISFIPAYFFQRYNTYLTLGSWDDAIKLILLYMGFILIVRISYILVYFFLKRLNARVIYNIRNRMNKKILNVKYESFKSLNTGEILNKLSSNLSQYISNSLDIIQYACSTVEMLGVIIYATIIAPWLSLILLAFGLVRWVYNIVYNDKVTKKIQKRDNTIGDKIAGVNNEAIRGMQDVKLLNIKDIILEKLIRYNDYRLNASYDSNNKMTLNEIINKAILLFRNLIFFVSIVLFLKDNTITLGTAMMFFTYRGTYENLFGCLVTLKSKKVRRDVAGDRLCEILDDSKFPIEVFGDKTIKNIKGKIEFKNVSFAYSDQRDKKGNTILDNISFVVEPNKCVGIVGESGAGKTTIINLIPRLYDCNSGKVLLDNKDIKTLDEETLRGAVSVVSQNPYIFNISFAENLRIVKKDATDEELIDIAKKVNLDSVISAREEGLETKLGEGGLQLSGGQRQRLAIARALLRDSKVLIFDEATSALDNENQREIQEVISKLQADHTVIIIAHRLSTIVGCDKLIFINGGKVIAEGTHSELMKNCKEYNDLYKIENKIG